jgi:hypothetical protein
MPYPACRDESCSETDHRLLTISVQQDGQGKQDADLVPCMPTLLVIGLPSTICGQAETRAIAFRLQSNLLYV